MTAAQVHVADVAIVGAGLAGLSAAETLLDGGLEVALLDARGRVGGRVFDAPVVDDVAVELGAQYCSPADAWPVVKNHLISDLARREGSDLFPAHHAGDSLLSIAGGAPRRFRGDVPPLNPLTLLEFGLLRSRLGMMARRLPIDSPWEAGAAERYDRQTLSSWGGRRLRTKHAQTLLNLICEGMCAAGPGDVSLLHALTYLRWTGELKEMMKPAGRFRSHRIVGGPHRVAERIAARIGDRVLLNAPVQKIEQSAGGVCVKTPELQVRSEWAIVTVPIGLRNQIQWEPALPASHYAAAQRMTPGSVVKFVAVYDEPFWRERGLNGQATAGQGPVRLTFDQSAPGAAPGMLAAYAFGDSAQALVRLTDAERRQTVLAALEALFGSRAGATAYYVEQDWISDPWARGGFCSYAGPGTWSTFGRFLAAPHGQVRWAGAETVGEGYGTMSGAIASGARAAGEILASARAPSSAKLNRDQIERQ